MIPKVILELLRRKICEHFFFENMKISNMQEHQCGATKNIKLKLVQVHFSFKRLLNVISKNYHKNRIVAVDLKLWAFWAFSPESIYSIDKNTIGEQRKTELNITNHFKNIRIFLIQVTKCIWSGTHTFLQAHAIA